MKASGNAAPETCVQNLLKTIRGEVPYERIKGIDRTLIDKPSGTAANDLAADVEFVVETYEPRVRLSSSDLVALVAQTGDFELRASIDNILKEVNSMSDETNTYGDDIHLTTTDATTIYNTLIAALEKGAGEPLYPGDERLDLRRGAGGRVRRPLQQPRRHRAADPSPLCAGRGAGRHRRAAGCPPAGRIPGKDDHALLGEYAAA